MRGTREASRQASDGLPRLTVVRVVRVLAPNPGVRELEGTNTWVVGGAPSIVIDPGPDDRGHLQEVLRTAGRIATILLTHDHPDHAPGATTLSAMSAAAVRAARPGPGFERIRDGEEVAAGTARVRAIATPGHSVDHLAFFLDEGRGLFTGDTVLGRGTSVIDPPEGDLAQYLRSLRRMQELRPKTIYPGHGPVVLDAAAKLEEYLAHREERELQVIEALAAGLATPEAMVPAIYADYAPEVYELAARSLLAHLLKLESEGRAERRTTNGEARWSASEPRTCERCGRRPAKARSRYCGPCSLAILQESG